MKRSIKLSKDILEIKYSVMTKRLRELKNICRILFEEPEEYIKKLVTLERQYNVRYEAIIRSGEYENYQVLEDIIMQEIAKIEYAVDMHVYETRNIGQKFNFILSDQIRETKGTHSYRMLENLDEVMEYANAMQSVLNMYSAYFEEYQILANQRSIDDFKFDIILRKHLRTLIYGTKEAESIFSKITEKEKNIYFNTLLELARHYLTKLSQSNKELVQELDKISDNNMALRERLEENNLEGLNRLVKIYVFLFSQEFEKLLGLKIFNAHLCNIANNIFSYNEYVSDNGEKFSSSKVNFSLLYAVLKQLITDENMSILECEKIYKKFGFHCRPIIVNEAQEILYSIFLHLTPFKTLKDLTGVEYEIPFRGLADAMKKERGLENKEGQDGERRYCLIDLEGYNYHFEYQETRREAISDEEIIFKRDNVANLLDRIHEPYDESILPRFKGLIEKEKTQGLTLQEQRQKLKDRYELKNGIDTVGNPYRELPLEDMIEIEGVHTQIPRTDLQAGYKRYGDTEEIAYAVTVNPEPLWNLYMQDFKALGMDIKSYEQIREQIYGNSTYRERRTVQVHEKLLERRYGSENAHYKICINMRDIEDLPIDEQKIRLLSKGETELVEAMARDEQERKLRKEREQKKEVAQAILKGALLMDERGEG